MWFGGGDDGYGDGSDGDGDDEGDDGLMMWVMVVMKR